jgi:hypothetical protein
MYLFHGFVLVERYHQHHAGFGSSAPAGAPAPTDADLARAAISLAAEDPATAAAIMRSLAGADGKSPPQLPK